MPAPMRGCLLDRYLERVVLGATPEACWGWKGNKTVGGYGVLKCPDGKKRYAHRISYELFIGPIPEGMQVLHHCDTPPCTNPGCLFVGTTTDNMQDMASKGRHWQQKKTHCKRGHPLTEDNLVAGKLAAGVRACRTCHRQAAAEQRRADPKGARARYRRWAERHRVASR